MIVIKQLRVDVLGEPLFEKVNLVITTGERVGVLGARASDVAAFLRVIADVEEMDEGTVTSDGERVGYISPEVLQGGADALARILHARPTFLIIDTHGAPASADMPALQRFVAQFRGGVLIASEHAELMHAARVIRVFEIDPATKSISSFTGNYSDYLVEREKVQARIAEAYEKQQREKRRLESWLEQKRMEATKDRAPEKGATIRTKAKYLQREILDKEIPKPFHLAQDEE